jgi:hypothetical protein
MSGYNLPVAADVYFKMFAVPDAQIPAAGAGLLFLQASERRVQLMLKNRGAGSTVLIGETEQSLAKGNVFVLEPTDLIWIPPFPPRNNLFAWKTGASDLRYVECIMQPFRQGTSDGSKGIRANVQTF